MNKFRFSKQGQKSEKVERGVPFVVTYHPVLNKPFSIIHKNPYLLHMNQEVKTVFTPGPMQKCQEDKQLPCKSKSLPLRIKGWFLKM